MKNDKILEIGINYEEHLYIKPATTTFSDINKEDQEINWDSDLNVIYAPKPIEWSNVMWYSQMIKAVKNIGYLLEIDSNTKWINISDDTEKEIKILARYKGD